MSKKSSPFKYIKFTMKIGQGFFVILITRLLTYLKISIIFSLIRLYLCPNKLCTWDVVSTCNVRLLCASKALTMKLGQDFFDILS